jgi:hypothetical protein
MTRKFVTEPMVPEGPLTAIEWLIKGMVPAGFTTCLVGLPGSFKTFVAVAMACCMATGFRFCERRTGRPRKVLYIAADDPDGPQRRAKAWVEQHQELIEKEGIPLGLPNLRILKRAINLHSENEVKQGILDLTADLNDNGHFVPEVVFIDTLFHSAIGAKFDKPEEMLPIVKDRLGELVKAIGARSCVLVHHTTKDGKDFYGSVVIKATVDVIINSVAKQDETTATLSCERMRGAGAFKAIDVTLTQVPIETEPDDEGNVEETQLVVTSSAPAAQPANIVHRVSDLEHMTSVLQLLLGNRATHKQWFDKMHDYTTKREMVGQTTKVIQVNGEPKVTKEGGELKVTRKGWSKAKFNRLLKELKEQGVLLGGEGQGDYYSVVRSTTCASGGGEPSEDQNQSQEQSSLTKTSLSLNPLRGIETSETGFEGVSTSLNRSHETGETGSRESGTTENPVESDAVLDEALDQLSKEVTKH